MSAGCETEQVSFSQKQNQETKTKHIFVTSDPFPVYLRHVNELSEDLGSLLGCVSAEDHQLDPLGDSVTHHDRPLQRRVVPHRASHHVAAVVQELANQISSGQSGNNLICVSI